MIGVVTRFGRWIFGRLPWWRPKVYATQYVTELPRRPKPRVLYVVVEDGFLEFVSMVCPCGCKQLLHMNLLPDERPCWMLTEKSDGTTTLYPSVWRKRGCRAHFWFRDSTVRWC